MANFTDTNNPLTLTIDENTVVNAVFKKIVPVIPFPTPTPSPSAPIGEIIPPSPSPTPTPSLSRGALPPSPTPTVSPSLTPIPSNPPTISGTVEFTPSLQNLEFTYQRGSNVLPASITVIARNTSITNGFSVTFQTNPEIMITPSTLIIPAATSRTFTVSVMESLYQKLGDGVSDIGMNVQILPV